MVIVYIVCTVLPDVLLWLLVYMLLLHIQDKMTPVYVAASHGQVGALKALISAGANFSTANVVSI